MSIASRTAAVAGLAIGAVLCWSFTALAADWPRRTLDPEITDKHAATTNQPNQIGNWQSEIENVSDL